jgi:hypothetical protein
LTSKRPRTMKATSADEPRSYGAALRVRDEDPAPRDGDANAHDDLAVHGRKTKRLAEARLTATWRDGD